MSDVFISYKVEDRPRVKPLVDALTAEGLSVWWDVHIAGGAAWREAIESHLDAAACVIVIWSAASVGPTGHFVQDEASRAERRGAYLPVAIDPVAPPLGFGQVQVLSLRGWRGDRGDERFQALLAAARAMMGAALAAPASLDRTGTRRAKPRPWNPWLIWPLAAVIPAIAIAVWFVHGWISAGGTRERLAIMPFEAAGGDGPAKALADGLSDSVANELTKSGLKPISPEPWPASRAPRASTRFRAWGQLSCSMAARNRRAPTSV